MSIRAKNINVWLAGLLVITILSFSLVAVPRPSRAASGCIAGLLSAVGAGAAAVGASVGLSVPTFDAANLVQNTTTAGATTGLKVKACQDEIITAVLKTVINLVRDMVIRWIITGRFEGPVFSTSFTADLQKSLENASRTFLGQLTGVNFCVGLQPPPQAFFNLNLNLALSCTFRGDLASFRSGKIAPAPVPLYESEDTPNEYWNVAIATADQKLRLEEKAKNSFTEEYRAGGGFLGIRDEKTGLIKIPASYTKKLAEVAGIESPQRQADVANTVQQAITAIIDTAIRTILEKGLSGISK